MTESKDRAPIRVLLVDDQPIVAVAVRRMLAGDADIELSYVSDWREAIQEAERLQPTVILQDLVMPDVDGLELVTTYRQHRATRDVPLIVLSATEEPEAKVQAFTRGANDYLVKLPHERELVARIRYHSGAHSARLERDRAFRELERHSRFIRDVFGRYVSDDVVSSLLERPGGLKIGGEHRKVTVLMADLRGFTTLSERLSPEAVVTVLNRFLGAMTDVIVGHGGTIDEILGDGLLVIFGAPVRRDDDARRAVTCAIDMQLALADVNAANHDDGLPILEMGIGVHTGEVVAGNIGSPKRAKYGVVGSAVNLTSRIESYTVGGQILISDAALAAAGPGVRIDGHLAVTPKGLNEPIVLFEIGGIDGPPARALPARQTKLQDVAPLPVSYVMLEGKAQGEGSLAGTLVRLSEVSAEIRADRPPRAFTDVSLTFMDPASGAAVPGASYGKVLPGAPEGDFRVRFTALGPAVASLLDRLRQSAR